MRRPDPDDVARFRGVVGRATPGVPIGSTVVIEREAAGWHLFVTSDDGNAAWAVTWQHDVG